ncbi:MAG TPA: alpha-ketoacid dehydrogenase subunit beta [Deltaproteobacteria bacterium]|jgi:pyruvate dehydrogenase E1 component beta subunit|nr:alpha-ketoacid dehydrogenase subunit beta [Deltaproteobacteria bacterium]
MARELLFVQAINEALHLAMQSDPDVILMGEDVAGGGGRQDQGIEEAWGGIMGASKGLYKAFGPMRVLDTPISEMGFLGAAVGAALTGLRPVVELMFMDFLGVALDPLLNQAAKLRYMFGGKARVPLTVRTLVGAGVRAAAQHSQTLYGLTTAIPGLKTVCPSTPADAKGLLLAAIRDDDPIVFCEPKALFFSKGAVPEGDYEVPIGRAAIVREGSDLTLVGVGRSVQIALDAAAALAAEGSSAEVVDLRSLSPLDEEAILASLAKTGRLLVIDEAPPRCGIASDVASLCVDRGFDLLNAPVKKVTAPHAPVPFSPVLEDAYLPKVEDVLAAVREMG